MPSSNPVRVPSRFAAWAGCLFGAAVIVFLALATWQLAEIKHNSEGWEDTSREIIELRARVANIEVTHRAMVRKDDVLRAELRAIDARLSTMEPD